MSADNGYILVVDDNAMHREVLSRTLQAQGHAVDLAADADAAVERLREETYDLVLLDVMMPGVSGIELLGQLRRQHSIVELPIIMVTANTSTDDIVKALELGANDYVTKPVDVRILQSRVATQLRVKRLSAVKDEFLAIASHDLKNPLGVVIGTTALLQRQMADGKPATPHMVEELDWIAASAKTMKEIILDFLDFQAMDDGRVQIEREPTDLAAIARRVVDNNMGYAHGKDITVRFEADDIPAVHADPLRFEQVMQNLINNAVKFSSGGSSVLVRIANCDDGVEFTVEDAGPGLTPEDMSKLFNKYARLSNKPTGSEKSSGLGLAICKKLVELHDGQIGARNNPERGATFWFRLPARPTAVPT